MYEKMKVNIPEGKSGDWAVERFTVSEHESKIDMISAILNHHRRFVPIGTYTRLLYKGRVIMSDTPNEIQDHMWFIRNAKGNILINGLGLGMALQACLEKPEVTHVTVIEISEDVIALVAPHFSEKYGDRVEIINADAMEWKPPKGVRYNAVWHDIWESICEDNLPEMKILHRRYGRKTDWQGSWCRELCERPYR
jgi:hypothetical protein